MVRIRVPWLLAPWASFWWLKEKGGEDGWRAVVVEGGWGGGEMRGLIWSMLHQISVNNNQCGLSDRDLNRCDLT